MLLKMQRRFKTWCVCVTVPTAAPPLLCKPRALQRCEQEEIALQSLRLPVPVPPEPG